MERPQGAVKIFSYHMEEDVLYPLSEAKKLVEAFELCTLPNEDWTHEAHLIVGLSLLERFGTEADDAMQKRLMRYNPTVGREGTYHATMTWFWLEMLRVWLENQGKKAVLNQENLDDLLFEEDLADRNLWMAYYTKEEMFSERARLSVLKRELRQ